MHRYPTVNPTSKNPTKIESDNYSDSIKQD